MTRSTSTTTAGSCGTARHLRRVRRDDRSGDAAHSRASEEEQDWFPKVREGLGRKQLAELGATMIEMKKMAPRSPAQPSALKKAIDAVIS